jgi:sporulation protein YlmC with PRC-barrel domain
LKTLLCFAFAFLFILSPWKAANAQNQRVLGVNHVLGMEVIDRHGAAIGEVKELMIDLQSGRVHYAVLELTTLGLGEKQFAYPASVLAPGKARDKLVLDIAREEIERSEGFERGRWPSASDEYWSRIDRRYGTHDVPEIAALDPKAPVRTQTEPKARRGPQPGNASAGQSVSHDLLRASQLLGLRVYEAGGRALGTVADMVIGLREARVRHLVVEPGRGARRLNVPPSQLALDAQGRALSLKADLKPAR